MSGLLIGRSSAPESTDTSTLRYVEALEHCLHGARFPVLYDVDIGHQPPQLTLIIGALAQVQFSQGKGSISQVQ